MKRDFFADAALTMDDRVLSVPPSPLIERAKPKAAAPLAPALRDRALPAKKNKLLSTKRRRGGALVSAGNFWVLHKKGILRSVMAVTAVAICSAIYITREELQFGADVATGFVAAKISDAGFKVEAIQIDGLGLTREVDVLEAIAIEKGMTSFQLDVEGARKRLEEIPSISAATIRKVYPDRLVVTIEERQPVARWRIDGAEMLIDNDGAPIARAGLENTDLALVIGEGAGDDAMAMITLMKRYPALNTSLAAISRIADRRWDLIYTTGLRVQLPEQGVIAALDRLNKFQLEKQLLDRDVDLIDMRVSQYVAVRPTIRDAQ